MAPKKGKGKGAKGSKGRKKKDNLTEEQKKKLAEQKALAEQEKITRRREVTYAFLKLKKEKEYELIKLNTNKLLDFWRPRLRKLKIQELMDDYKMMRNAFERAFDKKQNLMNDLQDALENNQKDYDSAVDSHMYNIDKMMEFYKKRLHEVRDSYNVERQKLVQSLNDERFKIQSYQDKSLRHLQNSMAKISKHFKEQADDSNADFALRESEIRNKGIEEIHIIKSKMDQRMNEMWKELHDRLVSYDVNVHPKRAEYLEYREKDLVMSSLIDSQFRRLYSLQEGITQMTQKTAMFDKALEHFLSQLYKKKKEYRGIYDEHMSRHREVTSVSQSAVRYLALTTSSIHDKMNEMLEQREMVIKTIERCRKRERMDEKIDPFLLKWSLSNMMADENLPEQKCDAANQMDATESDMNLSGRYMLLGVKGIVHDLTCDCNPCTCEIEGEGNDGLLFPAHQLVQEFAILERFWIRYNRVSLERAALGVRRQALLKDNLKLKLALRNYMGGLNPLAQDLCSFHEQVLEKDRAENQRIFSVFLRHLRRRERCRKVGGIRVY